MTSPGRWWRTVRHLKPAQVWGRLAFRIARPRIDVRPAPGLRPATRPLGALPARDASMLGATVFRFLNVVRDIDLDGWDHPAIEKLWRYNLHYFDDLVAAGAGTRRRWHAALLERWVRENPPGTGTGWEPYPTSLRIVNWVKAHAGGFPLPDACVQSLAVQLRWLERRLEYHLLGNHLLANAKALVFGGLFFTGREADRWRRRGESILAEQLPEQVLRDGGHFERSPMYHALLLEDLLDLANAAATWPGVLSAGSAAAWWSCADRMQRWLALMSHPDGQFAFFNDCAFGIARTPADLIRYASTLGHAAPGTPTDGAHDLPVSGYCRLQRGDCVVFADAAPIGPDYLPGHAHADTLSLEASLRGRRVLVNGGTSTYQDLARRDRERRSEAHNCLTVDGASSSETWASFRVGRRARVRDRSSGDTPTASVLSAAHDGFQHLADRPVHRREIAVTAGTLEVRDRVDGTGTRRHAVALHWHLHPAVVAERVDHHRARLRIEGVEVGVSCDGGTLSVERGEWHPEFGQSVARAVIVIRNEVVFPASFTTRFTVL